MTEYRNPQNEPGSDKRMLLALVAVFVVLGVMQYFMPKPQTPPDKGQQQAQQKPSPVAVPTASSTPVPPKTPAAALKAPVKAATAETESILETDAFRITFTNRGASVKSWILKKFTDDSGKPYARAFIPTKTIS